MFIFFPPLSLSLTHIFCSTNSIPVCVRFCFFIYFHIKQSFFNNEIIVNIFSSFLFLFLFCCLSRNMFEIFLLLNHYCLSFIIIIVMNKLNTFYIYDDVTKTQKTKGFQINVVLLKSTY